MKMRVAFTTNLLLNSIIYRSSYKESSIEILLLQITEKGLNLELVVQLLPPEIKDEAITNAKFCLEKIKGKK